MADGFQELVHKWWMDTRPVGCRAFIISKKLIKLREQLRDWAKCSFRTIKLKKLALLHDLEELDIAKQTRRLNYAKVRQELELQERLGEILKQEEIY